MTHSVTKPWVFCNFTGNTSKTRQGRDPLLIVIRNDSQSQRSLNHLYYLDKCHLSLFLCNHFFGREASCATSCPHCQGWISSYFNFQKCWAKNHKSQFHFIFLRRVFVFYPHLIVFIIFSFFVFIAIPYQGKRLTFFIYGLCHWQSLCKWCPTGRSEIGTESEILPSIEDVLELDPTKHFIHARNQKRKSLTLFLLLQN